MNPLSSSISMRTRIRLIPHRRKIAAVAGMLFLTFVAVPAFAQNAPNGSGSVSFNPVTQGLTIQGTFQNDRCYVRELSNGNLRVRLNNVNYDFSNNFGALVFNGEEGDDRFENNSDRDVIASGGQGNDRLVSTNGFACFHGDEGDDFLEGGPRDDMLCGGDGNDHMKGNGGDDSMYGDDCDENNDTIGGAAILSTGYTQGSNPGDDTMFGGPGHDRMESGPGNDVVFGGGDDDRILAGTGDDVVYAQGGDDHVHAGWGNDQVYGAGGNDFLIGHGGDDEMYGMSGFDTLDGGEGNDYLNGGSSGDILCGDVGNDTLRGMSGDDELWGGAGDDDLKGGTGNNLISHDEDGCGHGGGNGNELAEVSGRYFRDTNDNDVFNPGTDALVPGMLVQLVEAYTGNVVASQTTDTNGEYRFTNIEPGLYSVRFHRPQSTLFVAKDVGGDDTVDSDVNGGATGQAFDHTDFYVLGPDSERNNLDAGIVNVDVIETDL